MKNTWCSIVTALLIALTFTFNSLAQDSPQEDIEDLRESLRKASEDAIRESLRDSEKTHKIGKANYMIDDIKFSPDSTRFAVVGNFGILLYDVQRRGKKIQKVDNPVKLAGHKGRGWRVAFSPDGKLLASMNATGLLYIWDAKTEKLLRTIESSGCMVFSPDGRMIVTGGSRVITQDPWRSEGIVRLLDTQTGEHIRTLTGHKRHVRCVAFSPDSITIATGGSVASAKDGSVIDGTVRLWDTRTGQHIRTLEERGRGYSTGPRDPEGRPIGSFGPVNRVAFSPDGRTLASSDLLGVRLWDVKTGRLRRKFRERSEGHGTSLLVFSPDGSTIAVSGSGEIDLWDVKTGKQIQRVILEQNKWKTYQ